MGSVSKGLQQLGGNFTKFTGTGALLSGGDPMRAIQNLVFGEKKDVDLSGLKGAENRANVLADTNLGHISTLQPQQKEFGAALANQALGKGPSLAEAQLKSTLDRNLSQQLAAAKSQRGVNPALAQRQLMRQAGDMQTKAAETGVQARLQEQNAAQRTFGDYLNSLNANANQGINTAIGATTGSINAQNAANAADAKQRMALISGGMQAASMMSDEKLKKNIKPVKLAQGGMVRTDQIVDYSEDSGDEGAPDFSSMFKKPGAGAKIALNSGGIVSGTPKVKGDSEKNDTVEALLSPGEMVIPRTVTQQGPHAVKNFAEALLNKSKGLDLDKLQAYEYEYKDPKFGKGKQVSVMAQDMEKAGEAGRNMVTNTPEGKMIDYGKGFGAIVAAQAQLNQKLNELEKKYGKRSK